jgi:predicted phage-related endonuclease
MPLSGDELAAFLAARCGKLTASRMKDAIAVGAKGQPLKARADLIRELLAERLTGSSVRHYVNDAMQHGLDNEDAAKNEYEALTGNLIMPCGVYDHPRIDMYAATPDGLLDFDGLIETKCPTTQTFVDWVMCGVVPEEHKPQMLSQCACTGRRWVEFVAYDPRVRKMSPLFIRRFEPKPEEIAEIEAKAGAFLAEVDRAWELLVAAA